ncbi:hypothetical protein ATCC90586_011285 [Pythium insidiosum]|nr:hypothetical protein ATCC90586_011285 [Pythium insidiosum]
MRAAGQATYDLFLRHQAWKVITAASKSSLHGLVDGSDLQKLAEKYMGCSKDEVIGMRERLARQEAMVLSLESYLQEMADEQARLKKQLEDRPDARTQPPQVSEVRSEATVPPREPTTSVGQTSKVKQGDLKTSVQGDLKTERRPPVKTEVTKSVKEETLKQAVSTTYETTDYLADIYDDCLAQMQNVNVATRLRAAAVADLKSFDGRNRSEYRGKSWLSSVRAAFRRDQLTPGEACMQFPELLTDRAKTWYRQLSRETRKSWPDLQKAFELEYCGLAITAQQKYYELRRKSSEEPLDYLYRMNVQAMEAKIDYAQVDTGRFHVQHFINTCEDPDLARQLGGLRLTSEADLRDVLKEYLRQRQRTKTEDDTKPRWTKRQPKEKEAGRSRPVPVHVVQAASNREESTSEDEVASDSDMASGRDSTSGSDPDTEPSQHESAQDAQELVNPFANDCLCKGCGKLHEKGACPLEEIANGLRSWYDPSKHAGLLPPKIEKWLN